MKNTDTSLFSGLRDKSRRDMFAGLKNSGLKATMADKSRSEEKLGQVGLVGDLLV